MNGTNEVGAAALAYMERTQPRHIVGPDAALADLRNLIARCEAAEKNLATLRESLEPFADAHEHAMGCPCADTDREADASECDCGMTGLRAAIAATK